MKQHILSLINTFTWQDDILDCEVIEQGKSIEVVISLPYVDTAKGRDLQQHIASQMSDSEITVTLKCRLNQAPSYKQIGHIILVASGKGGVGKSTTAVNLAVALAQEGAQVGLVDADVYGPSIPLMLGMEGQRPTSKDGKIMEPLQGHGVKVNSIGFLIKPEDAAVWRGPMASSALSQLIGETNWGELDYLVVDMPPGTGDIQLTLSQKFPCTGAVIVTTPQNIALADAEKGISMFSKVNIPVLGMVENMSFFQCSQCGSIEHIFGQDGAIAMAQKYQTQLLGQVPLEKQNRQNGDHGIPTVTTASPIAEIYLNIARKLSLQLYRTQQNNAASSGPEISFIDD